MSNKESANDVTPREINLNNN